MNTTRLMINNTYDLFISKNNPFLLFFGLPNSPIISISDDDDDDDILTSRSDLEIESDCDNKSNEIVYKTFFSQLTHK